MKQTAAELVFRQLALANSGVAGNDVAEELARWCDQRAQESLGGMEEFRQRREECSRWMENDFSWRADAAEGNIFGKSNETLGVMRSQIGFVISRAQDDLFGSAPFFAALPEGEHAQDTQLADKLFKHLNWKLGLAGWERLGLSVVDRCFNFGEAIVRTGWRKDVWRSYSLKTVLVGADGEPVKTSSGEYVEAGDEWRSAGDAEGGTTDSTDTMQDTMQPAVSGAPGGADGIATEGAEGAEEEGSASGDASAVGWERERPARSMQGSPSGADRGGGAPAPSDGESGALGGELTSGEVSYGVGGGAVLVKDPSVVFSEGMRYEEILCEAEEVRYDGLNPQLIDWRNFRCSANFARIEDADFRGHEYEMRLSDLRRKIEEIRGPEEEWDDETVAMVNALKGEGADAKDEARKNGPDAGSGTGDVNNPLIRCLDCEVEWDPMREGRTAWFFVTVIPDHGKLVFVDYLANVLPEGDSMYTVISINNPPNRWHGRGWWELYRHDVMNTDRLWNLLLHRDEMHSNPITGVDENEIEDDLADVQPRPGAKVRLKTGGKIGQALQFAVIPDAGDGTFKMLQFSMTNRQLETGVTSAAQGGVGQLPATNTATGIQSVLSSGSTLIKKPEQDIAKGLENALRKDAAVLYMYQDKAETFRYGEGKNPELVQLSPEEVRGLEVRVTLIMTRGRQRDRVETARTAIGVALEYINVQEGEKEHVRPLFVEVLKGMEVQNPDGIIRQPLPPPPPPKGPQTPVQQITVNFKDLPMKAQAQELAKMGFEVTEEDLAAEKNADATREAAAKNAGKRQDAASTVKEAA